ncbi:MAG: hypothetical protein HZB38_02920 [Planctomycetes bacterium]|nr:hypothetical protein [Planctomycetota bacterium]
MDFTPSSPTVAADMKAVGYEPPSQPGQQWERPLVQENNSFFSYSYNGYGIRMTFWDEPHWGLGGHALRGRMDDEPQQCELPERKITKPDDMIVLADSDADGIMDSYMTTARAIPRARPGKRHNGAANVVFADQHVVRMKSERLVEEDEVERRRWNNDHDPHQEAW